MKLTVLGSGNSTPNLKRKSSSYLLEFNTKKILIDCGSGTTFQLEKLKKGLYKDLDYIFITHTHADHISDLMYLIHAIGEPFFLTKERERKIFTIGPPQFQKLYNILTEDVFSHKDKKEFDEIIEFKLKNEYDGFTVESFKTIHTDNSYALKFKVNDKTIVFSSDTGYSEGFTEFSKNADLLILECTINTTNKEHWEGHLNAEQCAKIAKEGKSKQLVLTHLPADEEDNQKKLEIVKKEFENVSLAYDLMEIEL